MKNYFINLVRVFKISPLSLVFISLISLTISATEIVSLGIFQFFLVSIFDSANLSQKLHFSFLENIESSILGSYESTLLLLLIFFFLLKNFLQIFLNYIFFTYLQNRHVDLLDKFFKVMLTQNYLEILREKSTKYNQIFSRYSENFVKNILGSTVKVLSDTIFLLCIIFYLSTLDFNLIITVIIVLIFFLILHNIFIKRYLTKNSTNISTTEEILKNYIYEYIKNIREILIFNLKASVLSKFLNGSKNFTKFEKKYLFVASLGRNIFEIIIICFIGSYFIFFFNSEKISEELPLLITIIFALLRLLPSINSINHSLAQMSQHSYAYSELKKFLSGNIEDRLKKINFNKNEVFQKSKLSRIELQNLGFSFNENKFLFKNLNFSINSNETVFIKGKSGSGKSTLVNLITNLIKPTKGNINFIDKQNKEIEFNNFGFVSQNPTLFSNTLKYNLTFKNILDNSEEKKLMSLIKLVDLNLLDNDRKILEYFVNEDGKNLSGGQLKKISLIRTVFADPEVIILDEITANLDDESAKKINNLINNYKENKIYFIISHKDKESLKYDKIINLDNL